MCPSSPVGIGQEELEELRFPLSELLMHPFSKLRPHTITIPVPLEAFGDAGLLGKDLHIQVIDGAVVITEDTDDE